MAIFSIKKKRKPSQTYHLQPQMDICTREANGRATLLTKTAAASMPHQHTLWIIGYFLKM